MSGLLSRLAVGTSGLRDAGGSISCGYWRGAGRSICRCGIRRRGTCGTACLRFGAQMVALGNQSVSCLFDLLRAERHVVARGRIIEDRRKLAMRGAAGHEHSRCGANSQGRKHPRRHASTTLHVSLSRCSRGSSFRSARTATCLAHPCAPKIFTNPISYEAQLRVYASLRITR